MYMLKSHKIGEIDDTCQGGKFLPMVKRGARGVFFFFLENLFKSFKKMVRLCQVCGKLSSSHQV